MFKTTKQHTAFWKNRQINWEEDYLHGVVNHPHRGLLLDRLSTFPWRSLLEVGMGAGANLVRILHKWPTAEVGGIDVNKDAVETAKMVIPKGRFMAQGSVDEIFLSDQSIDVVLSDACLIYIGPTKIKKALLEMKRVSRGRIVLCEFHSTSWWKRILLRWKTGYNAYDYQRLLEGIDCYDISINKIPKEIWPGTPWEDFGYIISCKYRVE